MFELIHRTYTILFGYYCVHNQDIFCPCYTVIEAISVFCEICNPIHCTFTPNINCVDNQDILCSFINCKL